MRLHLVGMALGGLLLAFGGRNPTIGQLLGIDTSAPPAAVRIPAPVTVPQPMPPTPGGAVSLGAEEIYAVESDAELVVLCHPRGLVKFEKVEPGTFYGRFAGGSGKWEKRVLKGPHAYIGTAAGQGRAELAFVPIGLKSEKDVVYATVDVDMGHGPVPPPKPKPEPKPEPAKNVAWCVCIEETTDRTPAVAALLNDTAFWRGLESRGVKYRHYDKDSPDAKRLKYLRDHPLPYLLLLDAQGRDARDGGEPRPVPLPANRAGVDALLGVK